MMVVVMVVLTRGEEEKPERNLKLWRTSKRREAAAHGPPDHLAETPSLSNQVRSKPLQPFDTAKDNIALEHLRGIKSHGSSYSITGTDSPVEMTVHCARLPRGSIGHTTQHYWSTVGFRLNGQLHLVSFVQQPLCRTSALPSH